MSPSRSAPVPSFDIEKCAAGVYDVLCVGFGPLGSVLAYSLASRGRKVLVVERDLNAPDRIVGELLQPGGCNALRELGMGDVLDDKLLEARTCAGYQILYGNSTKSAIMAPYPGEARGKSFHHGRFVHGLRMKAASHPNVHVVHATAKSLVRSSETGAVVGVLAAPASVSDEKSPARTYQLSAKLHVVADGCFSNFRKELISRKPIVKSSFVGLILEDAVLPCPNHGHVILPMASSDIETPADLEFSERGPILVYQLCPKETRMLIDIPGKQPNGKALKTYLEKVIAPSLPACLLPSFWATINSSDQSKRPRSMPNSFLTASPHFRDSLGHGVLLLGDALNMRHPLTGGGMTVAFNDCKILSELLGVDSELSVDLDDWSQVQAMLEIWWKRRKGVAVCVNTLAQALYAIFGSSDGNLLKLKDGCFSYLGLGGEMLYGPTSLLSALRPSPLVLFCHFFCVAFYSIFLVFWNASSFLSYPTLLVESVEIFLTACFTIFPVLLRELLA